MESSANNSHSYLIGNTPLFTTSELNDILDISLEFYKDGIYSQDSIDNGDCTAAKRKSMRSDFKDHFIGTSKWRKDNEGNPKIIHPKDMCLFRALLDSDTKRIIEYKRKNRVLTLKLKEQEKSSEQAISSRVVGTTRKLKEELRAEMNAEQTHRLMSQTNKILRLEDIIQSLEAEVLVMRENYVDRTLHDRQLGEYVELKEIHSKTLEKLKKLEVASEKDDSIKEKKRKLILQKQKELEELQDNL